MHSETAFSNTRFITNWTSQFGMIVFNMRLKLRPRLETACTASMGTLIRVLHFWIVMFCHMISQSIGSLKLLSAHFARQILLVDSHDVRSQLWMLVEAFLTPFVGTFERLGVCNLVSFQLLGSSEPFLAKRAMQRFILRMSVYMAFQMAFPRKRSIAKLAFERFPSLMHSLLVLGQK